MEQEIEITWNNANHNWFKQKGYHFTKFGDIFKAKIKDLRDGSTYKIKYECDYCHNICETSWGLYQKRAQKDFGDTCMNCAYHKAQNLHKDDRINRMYKKICDAAKEKGYELLFDISEYKNQLTRLKYICPIHGVHEMSVNNFVKQYGCPECKTEQLKQHKRLSINEVIKRIESINGNKLLNPNDYCKNNKRNLIVQCSCGNTFNTCIADYHKKFRCSVCSKFESRGELEIENFLKANNIKYDFQHTFENCKDINLLPFDFYLPDNNKCIEFDGEQHFRPAFGEKSFQKTKYHDAIKNQYCDKNNIGLIRIPYYDFDKINEILKDKLELCKRNSLIS